MNVIEYPPASGENRMVFPPRPVINGIENLQDTTPVTTFAFGRPYTSTPGVPIPVPLSDAVQLLFHGWFEASPAFAGLNQSPVIGISTTSYVLSDLDHGRILNFTNGSAVAVSVPKGLRSDFVCGIMQGGAGQVTLSAASGVTLNEPDGKVATEKRYVMLSLLATTPNVYTLAGRTA
jgi:hypothetical protein